MRVTRSDGPCGYVGYVETTIPRALFDRVQAAGLTEDELQRTVEAALTAACEYTEWVAEVRTEPARAEA